MALFGCLGWAALALLPAYFDNGAASRPPVDFLSLAIFFLVIVGTRGLAVQVLPETVVSLDSAFYIAAVVCLGPVAAGRLVAAALTLDATFRIWRADRMGRRPPTSLLAKAAFVVYFGGMTGGLLMAVGGLLGADRHLLGGHVTSEVEATILVFVLGFTLLVLHYLIQGVRLVLSGLSPSSYATKMALPGIVAEASLLPLGVVVVLLYQPGRPLGFAFLGATYLLINFVFNRLSGASASLVTRVGELETLNRTAHALGSTLQLHEVVEAIARETLAAIPEADLLSLTQRDGDALVAVCHDRAVGAVKRDDAGDDLLVLRVMAEKQPLYLPDARRSYAQSLGEGMRSWLGAPILVYDEVAGVLAVQSRERAAFSDDRRRLLSAIGAQAAVAIQNARLYELATVDGLTGLFVRRYFDSRLKEELERSQRFHVGFSLVLLDIDNFKSLNDTHGHPFGDRVLREIARVVKRNMRGVDLAARYGGEEFALILPKTTIVEAHAVCERIRKDVAQAEISVEGALLRVTASMGVAGYPDSGALDAASVVELADVALYRAKATGKNRVELYWDRAGAAPA